VEKLLRTLAIVFLIFVLVMIFFPVLVPARENGNGRGSRLLQVKQLGLGIQMYSSDHHDLAPRRDEWMDGILPYVKSRRFFIRPDAKGLGLQGFGYAFYSPLESKSLYLLGEDGKLPLVYESMNFAWNASDPFISYWRSKERPYFCIVHADGSGRAVPLAEVSGTYGNIVPGLRERLLRTAEEAR
jgi:hypothetical protein